MDQFNSLYSSESRTAGHHSGKIKSVQAWKTPKTNQATQTAQSNIIANLEKAADGKIGSFDHNIKTLNAYAQADRPIQNIDDNERDGFEFEDVVSIVNPLHHFPVIGTVYRGLTGSDLHPMSQIIGGALYGGPVGAITGTANAITKVQTGKDMGEHALNMIGIGTNNTNSSAIEAQLAKARDEIEGVTNNKKLPRTASAFANFGEVQQAVQSYQKVSMASGRTAGHIEIPGQSINEINLQKPSIDLVALPIKEDITTISLSPMPKARDV